MARLQCDTSLVWVCNGNVEDMDLPIGMVAQWWISWGLTCNTECVEFTNLCESEYRLFWTHCVQLIVCFGCTTIHNPSVSKICNITQMPKIWFILHLLVPLQQALPPFMEHFTCRVNPKVEGFTGIRGAARWSWERRPYYHNACTWGFYIV
jgi:hypothetical protein